MKPTMVLDDGRRLEDTEMYCSGIAVPCRRFAVRTVSRSGIVSASTRRRGIGLTSFRRFAARFGAIPTVRSTVTLRPKAANRLRIAAWPVQ